ncbi:hypothetical protein AAOGI_06710 [Agarivorans albus]
MFNSQLHPTFDGSSLKNYFDSPAQVAAYFGIAERTARDWFNKNQVPATAKRLMDIAASGFLPCALGWEDFRIFKGVMYTPSGQALKPEQLKAICTAFDLPQYERVQRWLNNRRAAPVPSWVDKRENVINFK